MAATPSPCSQAAEMPCACCGPASRRKWGKKNVASANAWGTAPTEREASGRIVAEGETAPDHDLEPGLQPPSTPSGTNYGRRLQLHRRVTGAASEVCAREHIARPSPLWHNSRRCRRDRCTTGPGCACPCTCTAERNFTGKASSSSPRPGGCKSCHSWTAAPRCRAGRQSPTVGHAATSRPCAPPSGSPPPIRS